MRVLQALRKYKIYNIHIRFDIMVSKFLTGFVLIDFPNAFIKVVKNSNKQENHSGVEYSLHT